MGAFTFTDAVDRYVQARESVREPDGKWHPSALYGCPRQVIYEHRGTTPSNPRNNKSKRTLWLGSRYHEWVQAALLEHPDILEAHVEVHIDVPDLNIVGDADVLYRTEAGWELGEIKSIGAFALKFAKELPKEDHRGQAETYWWALREYGSVAKPDCEKHPDACPVLPPLGDELERICFAYVGKDDLTPHESFVRPNPAKVEKDIREKIEQLSAYANDPSSLPPRLPFTGKKMDTKDWRCGYCPFLDLCWKQDPAEVDPEEDVW
jgi:hypothetical protein